MEFRDSDEDASDKPNRSSKGVMQRGFFCPRCGMEFRVEEEECELSYD